MAFLLFTYDEPSGGWDDLSGSFDTLDEAKAAGRAELEAHPWCVAHVVSMAEERIVWRCSVGYEQHPLTGHPPIRRVEESED